MSRVFLRAETPRFPTVGARAVGKPRKAAKGAATRKGQGQ
jgi:hypothetical protein